jgi:hypothetical protein
VLSTKKNVASDADLCNKNFNFAIGNIIAFNNKFSSTLKMYINCSQFHAEHIPTTAICNVVDYRSKGPGDRD